MCTATGIAHCRISTPRATPVSPNKSASPTPTPNPTASSSADSAAARPIPTTRIFEIATPSETTISGIAMPETTSTVLAIQAGGSISPIMKTSDMAMA